MKKPSPKKPSQKQNHPNKQKKNTLKNPHVQCVGFYGFHWGFLEFF